MKYIDADKMKAEIERRMAEEVALFDEQCQGGREPSPSSAVVHMKYQQLLKFIDQMQQEQPTPPGIEEERQKKGWLDYGLVISEIGLHRYNAVARIREHKEEAQAIMRNMNNHDLNVLTEYCENAHAEVILCCLQRYCMDFRFDQEEVKEIIRKEDLTL